MLFVFFLLGVRAFVFVRFVRVCMCAQSPQSIAILDYESLEFASLDSPFGRDGLVERKRDSDSNAQTAPPVSLPIQP